MFAVTGPARHLSFFGAARAPGACNDRLALHQFLCLSCEIRRPERWTSGANAVGKLNRRALFRNSLLVAGGAGATVLAEKIPHWVGPDRLPIDGGYAPTEDHGGLIKSGQVVTTWFVPTDEPVVALTFDDGPQPDWTPMVLDLLDEVQASATFFMVGWTAMSSAITPGPTATSPSKT